MNPAYAAGPAYQFHIGGISKMTDSASSATIPATSARSNAVR